jgi:hypothetical protein
MESTTGRVPSSPLYQAEITGQFEDNDPDPESFELSDDGLHFIQQSIKYAMSKLDKYRNLMERSVVYWAAMILHPGYGIRFLQLRLPNQVGSILRDFRDYFDRHYAQSNQAPVSPDSPPAFHESKLLLRTANFPRRPGKKLRTRSTYTYRWFQRKTSKKSNCYNGGLVARLSSHGYSIWRWTYFLSQPCPARMNVFSVLQSSPYLHKRTPSTGLLWRHCNASETGLALVRFPGQNQTCLS